MIAFRLAALLYVCACGAVLAQQTNALPTEITVDGVTYSNVTFGARSPADVVLVFHRTGTASIPLDKLPPEIQNRVFNFWQTLTVDGVTYSNVTFGSVTRESVYGRSSIGIISVPLAKLPPEIQTQFGYDPKKANLLALEEWGEQLKEWTRREMEARTSAESTASSQRMTAPELQTRSKEAYAEWEAVKQAAKPVRIKASQLHAQYAENEVSADAHYKGRVFLIDGVVSTIAKSVWGTPYVILEGLQDRNGVQCFFASSRASQLFELSPGDGVLIEGKVGGFMLGTVTVDDCTLRSAVNSSGKVK